MSQDHQAPQVLRTVAIYLTGDTSQRVLVDMLEGSEGQAIESAIHVLRNVAQHPERWRTRVVAVNPVTDV